MKLELRALLLLVAVLVLCGVPSEAAQPNQHMRKAVDAFLAGRFDEALPLARKAVEAADVDPLTHGVLGGSLLGLGLLPEAEIELRRAAELATPDRRVPWLGMMMADVLERRARMFEPQSKERTSTLEEALRWSDREADRAWEALEIRGNVLAGLGRHAEAVKIFEGHCTSGSMQAAQALAPLFEIYVRSTSPEEALGRVKERCAADDLDMWSITTDAFSSLYSKREFDVARKLAAYELGRRGKAEVLEAFDAGCSVRWMNDYLTDSEGASEIPWVGAMFLAMRCGPEAGLVDVGIAPAERVQGTSPTIPLAARSTTFPTLLVWATIDARGAVTNPRAVPTPTSSTFREGTFVSATLAAVRQWRYRPATKGGNAVAVPALFTIRFGPE
ncbi:MAG: hypothetical protein GY716_09265 [bacterium]|nr:hypothetical protein [bacterium]